MMPATPETFSINPHCRIKKDLIGTGHHQTVIVDDFYKFPEKVLQVALDLPYTDRFEIVGNFPGVRASINLDSTSIFDQISALWGCQLFPFFHPQPLVFQGIRNNRYRLNVGQRQPHIDQDITAMVYLNPPETCVGGTGLYRHRPTNLERVPLKPDQHIRDLADQLELSDEFFHSKDGYEHFQNSMIFNPLFAKRENEYSNDGNDYWELLQLIDMKPNRLIIFDGRCFHSQYIKKTQYTEAFRVNQVIYLSQRKM
ncbi:MAG: DUF6445 family protein [Nitrospirota bacterium]|nr:DUF6445 family protein [Nitrospirota bacterium]